ncbi:unnamed protein product, partial [Chrysoparadoxa australica]
MILLVSLLLVGIWCSGALAEYQVEQAFGLQGDWIPRATLGEEVTLTEQQRLDFANLVADDGLYRLRIREGSGPYVMTAVKACELHKSGFKEDIRIFSNPSGGFGGVDYRAVVGPLAATRDCKTLPLPSPIQIQTHIQSSKAADAQSIPSQAVAPHPPPGLHMLKEFQANDKGKKEEKSFFVKYVSVAVPCLAVLLLLHFDVLPLLPVVHHYSHGILDAYKRATTRRG